MKKADPASGRTYYWNVATKTSQWALPSMVKAEALEVQAGGVDDAAAPAARAVALGGAAVALAALAAAAARAARAGGPSGSVLRRLRPPQARGWLWPPCWASPPLFEALRADGSDGAA
ncbi:unnamed protein product [Prorocentrum cordatum]|uniref:WW domain-containing protein n=1 Tax=Prorocentrum cordatum TaxID=2364126 RepID=A0ABN9WXR5_9DINO|nr:unnamed protein product [Polarella glacialis]